MFISYPLLLEDHLIDRSNFQLDLTCAVNGCCELDAATLEQSVEIAGRWSASFTSLCYLLFENERTLSGAVEAMRVATPKKMTFLEFFPLFVRFLFEAVSNGVGATE